MKNLLLHICCAPCSASAIKYLQQELSFNILDKQPFNLSFYWYNPNIWDFDEYNKRKEAAQKYAKECNIDFFEEKDFVYDYEIWKDKSAEHCENCYRLRLQKTSQFAKSNGFDSFSTSLLSSPYQKKALINQIGLELENIYGIKFINFDFQKFFYEGKNDLKRQGYYIQRYCACNKSFKDRFAQSSDKNQISK